MSNPLRDIARKVVLYCWGVRPLNAEPYATHMPVLTTIAARHRIRRVAEFGAGTFSTRHFLDRTAFPDLELLVSFEDNPEWAKVVQDDAAGDARLELRVVENVPQAVPADLSEFDLIFIDDSLTAKDRAVTVRAVARANPTCLVVVHDFQLPGLRRTRSSFRKYRIVRSLTPQVGVLWQSSAIRASDVNSIVSLIRSGADLDVTHTSKWVEHART